MISGIRRNECLAGLDRFRLLGAISGDIAGSTYEFSEIKTKNFELFPSECNYTDDSILTVATADKLINYNNYAEVYRKWANLYPHPKGAYGNSFRSWLNNPNAQAYNSFGNGSAMRVSPAGYVFNSLEETLAEAAESASVTHNHPEGIRGAQTTAGCVFIARTGGSKTEIREFAVKMMGYQLDENCDTIRKYYRFNDSCQGTVPQALTAFLESEDFEDAIRLTISLGGDADTMGAITGAVAEAFYGGVPIIFAEKTLDLLPDDLFVVIYDFNRKFLMKK